MANSKINWDLITMISISASILYCKTWYELASSVRSVLVPIASMWYLNLSHVLRDLFREAQGKVDEPAYIKKRKMEKQAVESKGEINWRGERKARKMGLLVYSGTEWQAGQIGIVGMSSFTPGRRGTKGSRRGKVRRGMMGFGGRRNATTSAR